VIEDEWSIDGGTVLEDAGLKARRYITIANFESLPTRLRRFANSATLLRAAGRCGAHRLLSGKF